ncbi:MAG: hypothetical protein KDB23_07030 [Planctomycetales bacterium]|nr:hypothetical protein [Planctomycetales bacterium]
MQQTTDQHNINLSQWTEKLMFASNQNKIEGRLESLTPAKQAGLFLSRLYQAKDLVELRAIDRSGTKSRLVQREYLQPADIVAKFEQIRRVNESQQCEIFVGVNPRNQRRGDKDAVVVVRSIWVDLDNINLDTARNDWQPLVPEPTVIVSSGSGIHAYWKLSEPFVISDRSDRLRFEVMLQRFYADIGSDSVFDVSRVLRLPGTLNYKAWHHSGSSPLPCRLLHANSDNYAIATFDRWFHETTKHAVLLPRKRQLDVKNRRIAEQIVASLDFNTPDRSRRDFAVIAALLRAGISDRWAIYELVKSKSKFKDREPDYFERTYKAACRAIEQGRAVLDEVDCDDERQSSISSETDAHSLLAEPPTREPLGTARRSVTHEFRIGDQLTGTITVGLYPDGRPGEVFLRVGKQGSELSGLMSTIGALTSICLQRGVPVRDLADKFSHVRFEPSGITGNSDVPIAKSVVDYVFRWLGEMFG